MSVSSVSVSSVSLSVSVSISVGVWVRARVRVRFRVTIHGSLTFYGREQNDCGHIWLWSYMVMVLHDASPYMMMVIRHKQNDYGHNQGNRLWL